MPDHEHLLLQPWPKKNDDKRNVIFWPLNELLHSIKSFSAHQINEIEGKTGAVWEKERFDGYARSDRDLEEKFHYILRNPWDSGLARQGEDYPWVWTQDDEYREESSFRRDAETSTRDACATQMSACEEPQIIVGTHALLYESVSFSNLGLVVIDEQHKFGVAQRARLTTREPAPDVLWMTATPIPRTHPMTIYGDLDVSTIDEMPRDRKSTRLNSSHTVISYAVFCLKKKKTHKHIVHTKATAHSSLLRDLRARALNTETVRHLRTP